MLFFLLFDLSLDYKKRKPASVSSRLYEKHISRTIMKKILPAVKEKKELSFYPSKLSLLSLPVSRPKSNYYERTNGRDTLIMASGDWRNPKTKELEPIGLPYGIIPRHTLAYLCTKYHQNKRDKENPRIINLGNCLADFLRNIHCSKGGGRYKAMNNQLEKFFRCRLNYVYFALVVAERSRYTSSFWLYG